MRSFVAIDFETAQPSRHSPCAIGMVTVLDGVIIQRIFSLIRPPENEYSMHNTVVHGIKPEHTEYAPEFIDLYPLIRKTLHLRHIVCHNASFDLDVLEKTMNYHGINSQDIEYEYSDTLELYRKPLDECCKDCGIDLHHHDALADAEACARLFMMYNNIEYIQFKPGKHRSAPANYEFHTPLSGDVLKQDLEAVINSNNPFYDKKVVISGTYINWPDRKVLAKIIKDLGADIDGTVGYKTQILIAGENSGPVKLDKMRHFIQLDPTKKILAENDIIAILKSLDS